VSVAFKAVLPNLFYKLYLDDTRLNTLFKEWHIMVIHSNNTLKVGGRRSTALQPYKLPRERLYRVRAQILDLKRKK